VHRTLVELLQFDRNLGGALGKIERNSTPPLKSVSVLISLRKMGISGVVFRVQS